MLLYLEFFVVHTIESFALEDEEYNILRNIHCGNQNKKQEELVSKVAREL